MSITRFPPNTIYLGGGRVQVNDWSASQVISPGMLVERFNAAGVWRWRKSSVANSLNTTFATEQTMLNRGVNDDYAIGDLMEVSIGQNGTNAWLLLPSGMSVAAGDTLSDAGNGFIKAGAGVGTVIARALETFNNTAGTPGRPDAAAHLRLEFSI